MDSEEGLALSAPSNSEAATGYRAKECRFTLPKNWQKKIIVKFRLSRCQSRNGELAKALYHCQGLILRSFPSKLHPLPLESPSPSKEDGISYSG